MNVMKVFRLAFSVIFFCIGVWLLIYNAATYKEILNHIRESYKEKEIYQQYNGSVLDIVSYAELITTLCNTLEFDIVIDGLVIEKEAQATENIRNYEIRNINYSKTYLYDANGNIERIVYTGVTG